VWNFSDFPALSVNISKTVADTAKVTSRTWAFDWHQDRWPWMTLNSISLNFQWISPDFAAKRMKIGQYCQRQRCKHVELEQFLAGFFRRAGLSAIDGLSCYSQLWQIICPFVRHVRWPVAYFPLAINCTYFTIFPSLFIINHIQVFAMLHQHSSKPYNSTTVT